MEKSSTPPSLLIILLLTYTCSFSYSTTTTTPTNTNTTVAATTPSPSPTPSPTTRPPPTHGKSPPSTLDPKQLTALQSMDFPTSKDPCAQPSPHDNATVCDSATPFRHLISLRLSNCSSDLDISSTALRSLSTLRSLSFLHCPIPPLKHLPSSLSSSLLSFSCVSSLRRLTGVWLSRLHNVTDLTVLDVPVTASGPTIIFSQMHDLRTLTISRANLSGDLPKHWHSLNLTHVDLSSNRLKGPIPSSIGLLDSLESLNLSSNALTGSLPDSIGDLLALKNLSFSHNMMSGAIPSSILGMTALVHLDLSSNQFNGSVPRFLSEMKGLKYLNLQDNNFQGVIPFNASFLKRLQVLKVGGNSNLCYNHTLLSSKLRLGIAPCDRYGLPVSPPPDRSAPSDSSDYSGDDDSSGDKEKGGGTHHGPSKLVLGVAIGLSCFVFLVIFIVCISKVCR